MGLQHLNMFDKILSLRKQKIPFTVVEIICLHWINGNSLVDRWITTTTTFLPTRPTFLILNYYLTVLLHLSSLRTVIDKWVFLVSRVIGCSFKLRFGPGTTPRSWAVLVEVTCILLITIPTIGRAIVLVICASELNYLLTDFQRQVSPLLLELIYCLYAHHFDLVQLVLVKQLSLFQIVSKFFGLLLVLETLFWYQPLELGHLVVDTSKFVLQFSVFRFLAFWNLS